MGGFETRPYIVNEARVPPDQQQRGPRCLL
jgi:hypothetical protein